MRTLIIAMLGAGVGTAVAGDLFTDGGAMQFSWTAIAVVMVVLGCSVKVFHWALRHVRIQTT
jgi:hypothetical protein